MEGQREAMRAFLRRIEEMEAELECLQEDLEVLLSEQLASLVA